VRANIYRIKSCLGTTFRISYDKLTSIKSSFVLKRSVMNSRKNVVHKSALSLAVMPMSASRKMVLATYKQ